MDSKYDCKTRGHRAHPDGGTYSCYMCGGRGIMERWDMSNIPNDGYPHYIPGYVGSEEKSVLLKCECGADSVDSPYHSSWCPKA